MRNSLYILLSLLSLNTFAQVSGYFGKKNMIDIGMKFSNPMIYKIDGYGDDYYKASGTNLVQAKDRLDYAYTFNYSRILSNKFCLALEMDIEKFKHELSYNYYNNNSMYNYSGNVERLEFTSRIIMPKIQFNTKNSFFPVGTYHEFGFGFRNTKLVKKDYVLDLEKYNEDWYGPETVPLTQEEERNVKANFYDYSKNSFKGYVLYYSFNMRKPITKFLLINYGFSYTINKTQKNAYRNYSSTDAHLVTEYDVEEMIRMKKLYNFIQFKIGLTLAIF